jgi:hypothetical protein
VGGTQEKLRIKAIKKQKKKLKLIVPKVEIVPPDIY